MTPTDLNKFICGNTLTELKKLPAEFVDCVVTSPPYWSLRNYQIAQQLWDENVHCEHHFIPLNINHDNRRYRASKRTSVGNNLKREIYPEGTLNDNFCKNCEAWQGDLGLEPTFQLYLQHLLQIFSEVRRIMKPTGTLFVNLGDTYAGSGNGTNDYRTEKSKSIQGIGKYADKSYQGIGSAKAMHHEKNRYEPRGKTKEVQAKSLCGIPERFTIKMTDELGFIRRNTIIWWKRNCMPSSIKDRFTVDFEYVYFFTKSKKYFFERQIEPLSPSTFETAKYNRKGKRTAEGHFGGMTLKTQNAYFEKIRQTKITKEMAERIASPSASSHRANHRDWQSGINERGKNAEIITHFDLGRNMRCVWDITTKGYKEAHFATFPEELPKICIQAGCPPGGIVLDPFSGSGTTCLVAKKLERNYIGIDLNPAYCKMAESRIEQECGTLL